MGLQSGLQRSVLALQGLTPFRRAFALYYRLAAELFERGARRRFPEIERVFLRRGQRQAGWIPGASDLDFGVVVKTATSEEHARFVERFWRHYARRKRAWPILGETQIADGAQLAQLRGLPGLRLREFCDAPPPQAAWQRRWESACEALFSALHLLEQTALDARQRGRPDFAVKVAKGLADVRRYAEATADPAGPPARPRVELLRKSGDLAEETRQALALLDQACGVFVEDAVRELAPGEPSRPSPSWTLPDIDAPDMEWHGRLKELQGPGYPPVRGVYFDSVLRWIVVAELGDAAAFRKLFDKLLAWPAENSVFGAPAWVLPPRAFQALLWTPHLGTPLSYYALSSALNPWGVAVRPRGVSALDSWGERAQFLMKAGDFRPPPRPLLAQCARACAGSLALSLDLFALEDFAGGNAYKTVYLYSRLIGLHLTLKESAAPDPDDLEALARRLEERSPALYQGVRERLEEALAAPPARLNAQPAAACFARHFPAWRLLIDDALARACDYSSR